MAKVTIRKADELSAEGLAAAIGEGWQVLLDPDATPADIKKYHAVILARYRNNVDHAAKVPKSVTMFDIGFLLGQLEFQEKRIR